MQNEIAVLFLCQELRFCIGGDGLRLHICLPEKMDLNQSRDSPGGFMYTGPSRSTVGEDGDKGGNVERGDRRGKLKIGI